MKKLTILNSLMILILNYTIILGQEFYCNLEKPHSNVANFLDSHSFGYFYDSNSVKFVLDRQIHLINDSSIIKSLMEINLNHDDQNSEEIKIYYCGKYMNYFPENFNMHVILFEYRWPWDSFEKNSPHTYELFILNVSNSKKSLLSIIPIAYYSTYLYDSVIKEYSFIMIDPMEKECININLTGKIGNPSKNNFEISNSKIFKIDINGFVKVVDH